MYEQPRKSNTGVIVAVVVGGAFLVILLLGGGCVALARRSIATPAAQACSRSLWVDQVDGIVLQFSEARLSQEEAIRKLANVERTLDASGVAGRVLRANDPDVDAAVVRAIERIRSAIRDGGDLMTARAALYDAAGSPNACIRQLPTTTTVVAG